MKSNEKLGTEILEELGIDLHPEHIARIGDYMIGANNKAYDIGFKDGMKEGIGRGIGRITVASPRSASEYYRPLYTATGEKAAATVITSPGVIRKRNET